MEKIEVRFSDKSAKGYPKGILLQEILRPGEIVAAKVDGVLSDLQTSVEQNARVEWVPAESGEGQGVLRHTTSHVMAQAVHNLFPEAKITIGPAIKDGFYYDFDIDRSFSPEDFPGIEAKMQEIIKKDLPLVRKSVSREEARRFFQEKNEPYKVE
ncbi:MAG: threonine--tRNA ligase, partial [Deltaproteobacteria bacterium]|nr:threonine--tRNA ligase [Deltaproteobacteria bacterium]